VNLWSGDQGRVGPRKSFFCFLVNFARPFIRVIVVVGVVDTLSSFFLPGKSECHQCGAVLCFQRSRIAVRSPMCAHGRPRDFRTSGAATSTLSGR
jgi:hypothetical protein